MKQIKKIISFFANNSIKRISEILLIYFYFIKAKCLVQYIPLKLYYYKYFSDTSTQDCNLQPFYNEICLFRKVAILMPFQVTCLMESIAFKSFMKRYKITVPIKLGVKINNKLSAHSWYLDSRNNNYHLIRT